SGAHAGIPALNRRFSTRIPPSDAGPIYALQDAERIVRRAAEVSEMSIMTAHKPTLWSPGDWNAFFGFGTNILVNMLTMTALLLYVLKMPPDLVFWRILPATGLMLCLSTFYYAWLAYRLAQKTGRTDVCA